MKSKKYIPHIVLATTLSMYIGLGLFSEKNPPKGIPVDLIVGYITEDGNLETVPIKPRVYDNGDLVIRYDDENLGDLEERLKPFFTNKNNWLEYGRKYEKDIKENTITIPENQGGNYHFTPKEIKKLFPEMAPFLLEKKEREAPLEFI